MSEPPRSEQPQDLLTAAAAQSNEEEQEENMPLELDYEMNGDGAPSTSLTGAGAKRPQKQPVYLTALEAKGYSRNAGAIVTLEEESENHVREDAGILKAGTSSTGISKAGSSKAGTSEVTNSSPITVSSPDNFSILRGRPSPSSPTPNAPKNTAASLSVPATASTSASSSSTSSISSSITPASTLSAPSMIPAVTNSTTTTATTARVMRRVRIKVIGGRIKCPKCHKLPHSGWNATACGHVYCETCIKEIVYPFSSSTSRKGKCLACGRPVRLSQITKLFL